MVSVPKKFVIGRWKMELARLGVLYILCATTGPVAAGHFLRIFLPSLRQISARLTSAIAWKVRAIPNLATTAQESAFRSYSRTCERIWDQFILVSLSSDDTSSASASDARTVPPTTSG